MPNRINQDSRKHRIFHYFLFFFCLNLSSNLFSLKDVSTQNIGIFTMNFAAIVSMSAITALIESSLLHLCSFSRVLKVVTLSFLIIFHLLLIGLEMFLYSEFGLIIGQDVIDVLSETNAKESQEFFQTYLSCRSSLIVLIPFVILVIAYKVNRWSEIKFIRILAFVLCSYGLVTIVNGTVSFVKYRNGDRLPQSTSITRGGYAYYVMHRRSSEFSTILDACQNCDAKIIEGSIPFKHVIVVIGESSSFYHCSLYGYSKLTFPRMGQLHEKGSLLVYNDMVTHDDATHGVMKSIFSMNRDLFSTSPLFPSIFKKVGYSVQLLDNQYFVSSGVNFLTDKSLSEILFDNRNDGRYKYDGYMLNDLLLSDTLTLNIVHLIGQHYTYSQRYPNEFNCFEADDYDRNKYSAEQCSIISNYDNAGVYCDFVLGELIESLNSSDAILFFMSDHGEEVYDLRNYMGHGTALSSPDPSYQLRIPFFIWMSDTARRMRPDLFLNLNKAENVPAIITDFSHLLLSVCGIESSSVDDERCFISPMYNKDKPRIVLHSIDFDKNFGH